MTDRISFTLADSAPTQQVELEHEAFCKLAEFASQTWHRWHTPYLSDGTWKTFARKDPAKEPYPAPIYEAEGATPGQAALALARALGLMPEEDGHG